MRDYNTISALFGNNNGVNNSYSINLNDYSMIKSGGYKKLMKAYYAGTDSKKLSDSDKTNATGNAFKKLSEATDKTGLTKMKAEADSLKKATSKLTSDELWKKADQADMNAVTDAVKNFANNYNKVVDQSAKTDNADVENNMKWMTSMTKTMSKALDKIGISVGDDNKLTVNEDKLKNADVKNVKELFAGSYSYGGQIEGKASSLMNAAGTAGLYNANAYMNNNLQSMFSVGI